MTIHNQLTFKNFLQDSAILNGLLGTFIAGTMVYDAEIWLNDYPPDIKEKFGPQSDRGKRRAYVTAVPFFALMIGSIVWSNLRAKRRNGGRLSVSAAFLNAYALIFSGWFLDLAVLDWLVFVRHTPDFVVLPGTEGMAGYDDYGFHLRAHMRALPLLALPALLIALITASRPRYK